jgi:hypothetical protein
MYELHKLTGSVLVDANGRAYGNESSGVVSRHRTVEAAEKAGDKLREDYIPFEIRDAETGKALS